jgi:hypothetical protein
VRFVSLILKIKCGFGFYNVSMGLLSQESRSNTILRENCPWRKRELRSIFHKNSTSGDPYLMEATFLSSSCKWEFPFLTSFFFVFYIYIYICIFLSLGTHFLPNKETYVRYILINYFLHHGVYCTTLLKCDMQQAEGINYHNLFYHYAAFHLFYSKINGSYSIQYRLRL